jgi:hypothetical protein
MDFLTISQLTESICPKRLGWHVRYVNYRGKQNHVGLSLNRFLGDFQCLP